jgi:aspartate carbamoyltransferase catalytic subunit
MKGKILVSITDLTADDIMEILRLSQFFEQNPQPDLLEGKVIATVFYEPSTRTRLSFETAVQRLGGRIIGFADASSSSVRKGESLKDTILTVANYSDLIVLRHPLEGSARYAAEVSPVPIVNAGDGANQHPTQTLLDLYSIQKTQGRLDNLNIFLVGDLKYGRTVHSLVMALSHFTPRFVFISHPDLRMPREYTLFLEKKGIEYHEQTDFQNLDEADVLYVTRVQRERFSDPIEYEKVKDFYRLTLDMLENTRPNLKVMHPLPRVDEIATEVDTSPKAYYFQQARNGVFTRQAIIARILDLK